MNMVRSFGQRRQLTRLVMLAVAVISCGGGSPTSPSQPPPPRQTPPAPQVAHTASSRVPLAWSAEAASRLALFGTILSSGTWTATR